VSGAVKEARGYNTQLRREQAQLTRQRILEAARRLMVGGAYSQVTMHDIAREAGVAYQTVYSQFGNKLQLALDLCTSEFPHVGKTVAMLVEARDSHDPEGWLRTMGPFARRLYEPCAEVLRFMRESGEPELIGRYREIERGRFERLVELGPQLEETGRLRPRLSGGQAVDLVWEMSGPETYAHLVLDRGWTPDQFEAWLGAALVDLVLVA
jgi:AcrR family transcriptional regulator